MEMNPDNSAPFLVGPGETRGGQPLHIFGDIIRIKVAGSDTNGRYAIGETTTSSQGGPPLHNHTREDEWFYILEGEYVFEIGGKQVKEPAGSSLFAPLNIPHTFQ